MNYTKNKIQQIKAQSYTLKIESVLEQTAQNYKKIALYAGLLILVFTFFFVAIATLVMVLYFGTENVLEMMKPENLKPENFSKDFILIYSICSIFLTALLCPFSAGFIKMAHCAAIDQEFTTASIFDYYTSKHFKELFLSSLVITLFNTMLSSTLELAGLPAVGMLATMVISFFTMITLPLIIFGNLTSFDAIKNSIIIVSKQPLLIAVIATSLLEEKK